MRVYAKIEASNSYIVNSMQPNTPEYEARILKNAGALLRPDSGAVKPQTPVNSDSRAAQVAEFKAARPSGGNRDDYIAWAETNPNRRSNAARKLGKASAAAKAARAPKAPVGPKKATKKAK